MMLITKNARVNDLQRALRLHQAGELNEAGDIYTDILRGDPDNPDALHLLGLVAYQQGRAMEALELVRRAIAINDADAYYHNNLGEILQQQGRLTEAIASFSRALELFPGYEEARVGLADARRRLKENPGAAVDGGMRAAQGSEMSSGLTPETARERQWEQGISHEMEFWDEWLRTGGMQWAENFKARLDPELPFSARMVALLGDLTRDEIDVLDVGAGPLTVLGKKIPGKSVRITAIDPLAGQYDVLLEKYGIAPSVRTERGFAEKLTDLFAPGSFDIVHAQNCLDHGIDPVHAIRQMLEVVRDDGYIMLNHHENEGENENYAGFHQWNFTSRNGEFIIGARDGGIVNVSEVMRDQAEIKVHAENHYLSVVINKKSRTPAQDAAKVAIGADAQSVLRYQAAATAGFAVPANMVDKNRWIADVVKGKSFADIGGLWGTVNEMVTVAAQAGAVRAAMVDMQPVGNEWWQAFNARCDSLGVEGYESYYANLEDADLVRKIGTYDVVHCSGILYHAPDPMHLLRQLFRVTNEYLILTTMAIPDTIPSVAGDLKVGGGAYLVPTLSDGEKKIFSEFFDAANIKLAGINGDAVRQWVDAEGRYDYSPWWWLWTPEFVMNMLKLFPCEVIAHGESWAGRSYSYLCRKKQRA